jgi:hypothetical protein
MGVVVSGADYWFVSGYVGAIFFLWIIRRTSEDDFTHAHLFSALWGTSLLASHLLMWGALRPEVTTLGVLFGTWWAFLIGSLLVLRRPNARTHAFVFIRKNRAISVLVLLICLQLVANI